MLFVCLFFFHSNAAGAPPSTPDDPRLQTIITLYHKAASLSDSNCGPGRVAACAAHFNDEKAESVVTKSGRRYLKF